MLGILPSTVAWCMRRQLANIWQSFYYIKGTAKRGRQAEDTCNPRLSKARRKTSDSSACVVTCVSCVCA